MDLTYLITTFEICILKGEARNKRSLRTVYSLNLDMISS